MKKGFTLIELLGVIVVLGIIATITVPTIQNTIVKQNENAYNDQIKSFEKAAKNYVAADPFNKAEECKNTCSVTLQDLQNEGYLDTGNIENPKTGENFDLENEVDITFENGKFTYKYDTSQDD